MAVKTGKINEFISWLSKNYPNESAKYSGWTKAIINAAKDVRSKSKCLDCDLTKEFNKVVMMLHSSH